MNKENWFREKQSLLFTFYSLLCFSGVFNLRAALLWTLSSKDFHFIKVSLTFINPQAPELFDGLKQNWNKIRLCWLKIISIKCFHPHKKSRKSFFIWLKGFHFGNLVSLVDIPVAAEWSRLPTRAMFVMMLFASSARVFPLNIHKTCCKLYLSRASGRERWNLHLNQPISGAQRGVQIS